MINAVLTDKNLKPVLEVRDIVELAKAPRT
jgi:hypothetical protein